MGMNVARKAKTEKQINEMPKGGGFVNKLMPDMPKKLQDELYTNVVNRKISYDDPNHLK